MFNKEKKTKKAEKEKKKDEKKLFSKLPEVTEELDEFDRPMQKVNNILMKNCVARKVDKLL